MIKERKLNLGIFSNNYESAGVGIAKNAPKSKGIKLFFEILWRKAWKLMGVNLLYSIFFILPILSFVSLFKLPGMAGIITSIVLLLTFAILIGPATAGMTKVIRNYVLERNSFILHDFFKSFKQNFGKAAFISFFDCLIALCVWAGYNVYPDLAQQMDSKLMYVPMIISLSLGLVVAMMNFYAFLMLVATDLSLKNLLKNSFALAFIEMKKSVITLAIYIIVIVALAILTFKVSYAVTFILLIFPAAFLCFVSGFNCYPAIQKYVINPYYTSIGEVNPELDDAVADEETIFEDMGGKEKPIEKRKKGKGKRIS